MRTERRTRAETAKAAKAKPVKMSYREQQELEGMEAAIAAAEAVVVANEAKVQEAALGLRSVLEAACLALTSSQKRVEALYQRWQELEAKRNSGG